ncbi:MAG: hypothetical protein ONB44_10690 [candidate division KSB1 bacterium]|nr:hypothetical protein [candidate division KSB1 bacterium]MDZ7302590.1 hypothetical protein [candidate division KSB1 bacterium]MDZ7311569.1 hypothetical protein [candidate division KSB1 bacterium]
MPAGFAKFRLSILLRKAVETAQTAELIFIDTAINAVSIKVPKNLGFSKHSGVISTFNQHFIKPAIFPKEFSKLIERVFRDRQTGDYKHELSTSEDDPNEDI